MRQFLCTIALLGAGPACAEATLISTYVWQDSDPNFGGFSAIEVSDDGSSFIALSDRGHMTEGRFVREDGVIEAVNNQPLEVLRAPHRAPLRRHERDSEGLAHAPDGGVFVSFEWTHGLRYFERVGAFGSELIDPPTAIELQSNSSFEALAIGLDGALYTLPERSGLATRPFPVFRYKEGVWDQPFEVPRTGPYLMAGADIGPDGRLYLLERDFAGVGFRTRVRRFDLNGGSEELILQTGLGVHDNLEGISVWEDADGLRLTMISDDNFSFFQQTQIVEYRLTD
ncbi:esterase-like activity of phytase family protein [Cognatiyoonia sp. IB215182]|uniref:esterase-like activity of phytase family protein n=1 Tax=Cognatiyoonia sp. IB215182 TaxID=3097353 RepID=UPI002A0F1504|nr:esterase-like activity of phytase family protein [Cognatiyoonia sp. IB215182]MDX8352576.1 esterase-like activity of phytase family protein [Cognatiyoonia sp. IB215182]